MFQEEHYLTVKIVEPGDVVARESRDVILSKYPKVGMIVYLSNKFYRVSRRVNVHVFELKEVQTILGEEVN